MGTQITFYGHAALGIETGEYTLLVDPYFTGNPQSAVDVETITTDYILVTHGHGDHLGDTVPIAKRTNATVICNTEIGDWLEQRGVKTWLMQVGGSSQLPFGRLSMTFALHSSTLEDSTYGGNPAGFLLTTILGEKIYLAGDTGLFGDMKLIGEEGIDLAVLPIGGKYTMDSVDALKAVELIQPRVVIPIHYNTFDAIRQDAQAWKAQVEAKTKTRVVVLQPGEMFEIK